VSECPELKEHDHGSVSKSEQYENANGGECSASWWSVKAT
jgi:hypothetical protein